MKEELTITHPTNTKEEFDEFLRKLGVELPLTPGRKYVLSVVFESYPLGYLITDAMLTNFNS